MATFKTSLGRPVSHCHVKPHPKYPCRSREWTLQEQEQKTAKILALFPDYVEVAVPTCKFNCHGFSFTGAHGWFDFPSRFIEDDFTPVTQPRVGDLLVYEDDVEFTHSGFVAKVTNGKITLLRSKMGRSSTVLHRPERVAIEYGNPTMILRRNTDLP
jgi:hypothetical protein